MKYPLHVEPHAYSLPKALLLILCSVILVTGSTISGWLLYQHFVAQRRKNPVYTIQKIRHSQVNIDSLPTAFLAKYLGLSEQSQTNLFAFDVKESKKHLRKLPVLSDATLRLISPDTLDISYTMRRPLAFCHNCSNTAVDSEGILFPFSPFYTRKQLPTICFPEIEGCSAIKWGNRVELPPLSLAKWIVQWCQRYLAPQGLLLCWIDVSQAWSEKQSQEQIILSFLDEENCSYLLRLPREDLAQALTNARVLFAYLAEKEGRKDRFTPLLFDFRLPHLATFKEVYHEALDRNLLDNGQFG